MAPRGILHIMVHGSSIEMFNVACWKDRLPQGKTWGWLMLMWMETSLVLMNKTGFLISCGYGLQYTSENGIYKKVVDVLVNIDHAGCGYPLWRWFTFLLLTQIMIANRDINRLSAGHSFQNRLFSCHPYLI
jgi:hypothetical protein